LYKEPYCSYNFQNGFAGKDETTRSNSSPKDSHLPAKFFLGKKSMANEFDTDYSFLNLPEAGSSVRGPIERPSFDPNDFSFNLDRYAPSNLPDVEMVAPSLPSLSADENEAVLTNARPFEAVETLGATLGERFAKMESFFGNQLNELKDNIQNLEMAKSEVSVDLENAIQTQDQIKAELAQQQIQALEEQKQELQMQLQNAVAEAESQGIDAVAAAEAKAAENLSNVTADFQNEINNLTGARDSAIAERDQALSQQDIIRAEAAEAQAQALDAQAGDYQSQLAELTGQSTGYQDTIADLQSQIAALQNVGQPPEIKPIKDPIGPIKRPPRPPIMCFVAGTKVDMADGTKKVIENIAVGDEVMALGDAIDKVSYVHNIPKDNRQLWTINNRITATDSHAFLTKDGWKSNNSKLSNTVYNDYGIEVKDLQIGDELITNDGVEKITTLENKEDFVKVYNFTTSNTHTYLVDGVVSHNKMADRFPPELITPPPPPPTYQRPPPPPPPEEGVSYIGGSPGFYDKQNFGVLNIKKPQRAGGIGGFNPLDKSMRDYKIR
jgi:hypothetical protein